MVAVPIPGDIGAPLADSRRFPVRAPLANWAPPACRGAGPDSVSRQMGSKSAFTTARAGSIGAQRLRWKAAPRLQTKKKRIAATASLRQ